MPFTKLGQGRVFRLKILSNPLFIGRILLALKGGFVYVIEPRR